jgi:hypothetical protein
MTPRRRPAEHVTTIAARTRLEKICALCRLPLSQCMG